PPPRVAVLIGGRSRTHDLSPERAREIGAQVRNAVGVGSLLMTLSRRTPEAAQAVLKAMLADLPGLIYDGQGENPYFAFLQAADHILVTEDSVNMATEAAVTGKPIHRLAMDALRPPGKFARFDAELRARGIARPFDGRLDSWSYEPLDETARAAQRIIEEFAKRA
ncbi:MAG: mitochondrial fission ELM1 family protein, partial [Asticcacaulis sp.]|nr:mitochondrial fission ELM1 family protein [Asticcacaulis sp.]